MIYETEGGEVCFPTAHYEAQMCWIKV